MGLLGKVLILMSQQNALIRNKWTKIFTEVKLLAVFRSLFAFSSNLCPTVVILIDFYIHVEGRENLMPKMIEFRLLTKFWVISTTATHVTSIEIHLFHQPCNIFLCKKNIYQYYQKDFTISCRFPSFFKTFMVFLLNLARKTSWKNPEEVIFKNSSKRSKPGTNFKSYSLLQKALWSEIFVVI